MRFDMVAARSERRPITVHTVGISTERELNQLEMAQPLPCATIQAMPLLARWPRLRLLLGAGWAPTLAGGHDRATAWPARMRRLRDRALSIGPCRLIALRIWRGAIHLEGAF